jgi:GT2 family glycosyltransferase
VVVVSYNSASFITGCLRSVLAQEVNAEILVVDNASTDASADLAAKIEGVRVLRNISNRGFAAAANQGAAAGCGDVVVLVNPDAELLEGSLARMVSRLQDPEIGVGGGKILELDGATLQHVGGIVHANGLTDHRGRGERDRGQYDETCEVTYVTGALFAVRRGVWEEIGGFDAGYYPAYFEEVEFCWQARHRGYRVMVVPEAVAVHHEGGSSHQHGDLYRLPPADFLRAYHRNRIRFVLRNFSLRQIAAAFVPAELRWLVAARPRGQLGALARAYSAAALALPSIVAHRARRKSGRRGGPITAAT